MESRYRSGVGGGRSVGNQLFGHVANACSTISNVPRVSEKGGNPANVSPRLAPEERSQAPVTILRRSAVPPVCPVEPKTVVLPRHDFGMLDIELLRPLLLSAWGPDTCDPHDLASWRPENPARGQCGTTALLVQDMLGGELILGQVPVDAVKIGHHYWNRLPDGTTVDLTAEQFLPGETVVGGEISRRPADAPRRCRGQYELLRHRMLRALADEHPELTTVCPGPLGASDRSMPPVQIAVVALTDRTRAVLLQLRGPDVAAEPGQCALSSGRVDP